MAKLGAITQFDFANISRKPSWSASVKPDVPTTAWTPFSASPRHVLAGGGHLGEVDHDVRRRRAAASSDRPTPGRRPPATLATSESSSPEWCGSTPPTRSRSGIGGDGLAHRRTHAAPCTEHADSQLPHRGSLRDVLGPGSPDVTPRLVEVDRLALGREARMASGRLSVNPSISWLRSSNSMAAASDPISRPTQQRLLRYCEAVRRERRHRRGRLDRAVEHVVVGHDARHQPEPVRLVGVERAARSAAGRSSAPAPISRGSR